MNEPVPTSVIVSRDRFGELMKDPRALMLDPGRLAIGDRHYWCSNPPGPDYFLEEACACVEAMQRQMRETWWRRLGRWFAGKAPGEPGAGARRVRERRP